jgi:hypothetical protein
MESYSLDVINILAKIGHRPQILNTWVSEIDWVISRAEKWEISKSFKAVFAKCKSELRS